VTSSPAQFEAAKWVKSTNW